MARRSRAEMMEETRLKLMATAREHFGTVGYAQTVMDDLTAKAGLTRGALYHHFGDKKGLFCAVLTQIDSELDARLANVSANAPDAWSAFTGRCHAYLKMAIEPEVQRILLRDASSVLDADELQSMRLDCLTSIADMLGGLMDEGTITPTSPDMLARLLNGGLMDMALWIAKSEDDEQALYQALSSLDVVLSGLKI
ncbi:TetR/AcrR family transcriptional regulator [Vibrio sp. V39_P1S14PM300]|uniref:TetR/AcrR family transcriptional regulator n=1 Tax=Vibrio sp. V39_P1S14PM300 TaxID=1938690 RepID=UPI00137277EA|nr:TetR/AcrR family transcriptional regulator [Vibrio sp. V39_P1S14PM300]NAX21523.1 TetR family transcriptional regulator [Vibrio sp. V39_P1S14PM300]